MRNDTYTGGEHYWIAFYAGHFEIRRETYDGYDVVWFGEYNDCLEVLNKIRYANADYDLNL